MKKKTLTDAQLLLLGLVAEMPRHGYELEQVIEQRGMREWTQIGFSSIYFVLSKLEKMGFVSAKKSKSEKAKKTFSITDTGYDALVEQALYSLRNSRPTYSSALLGMAHWSMLEHQAALSALQKRGEAAVKELERIENIQLSQQPLPDFVEAIFDFSLSQLQAEVKWIERTYQYMKCKHE